MIYFIYNISKEGINNFVSLGVSTSLDLALFKCQIRWKGKDRKLNTLP